MRVSNLKQIYNSFVVLDIENLEFDSSKITALMGTNGSGKSTLLRLIAGLEKGVSGEIKSTLKPSNISILLPEPMLLKRSVRENFKFILKINGLENEFESRVGESLELAGLDESFLDKKHYALSSGQTQRVAFALVLALRKPLILLDEPTNSLDLASAKLFANAIEQMNEKYGCGFIIASHDEKWLSAIAHESVFLHAGKVAQFEYKNIFRVSDGAIKFSDDKFIKLPLSLAKFNEVAINLNEIEISTLPKEGFLRGAAHSISSVYKTKTLAKIKYGEYLIKLILDEYSREFGVGSEVYFKVKDGAYVGL
ncbi:MAG: ATP-binding cassette domain-containing protein [Campylobacteraceae bacterium]|nr:ATP-binding cassette domain-containing protein [Campylobacteraceae bacterium]